MSKVQKIDQWYDEHPNQIHEVPVKAQNLDVIRIVAPPLVTHAHNDQSDYAASNVGKVQASDTEKRRPKQSRSPGVLKEGTGLFGASFFSITGLHLTHVTCGVIALIVEGMTLFKNPWGT